MQYHDHADVLRATEHPSDDVLIRYARSELRVDDDIVEPNHVVGCQRCNDRLAELDLAPAPSIRSSDDDAVTLRDDELQAIADEADAWPGRRRDTPHHAYLAKRFNVRVGAYAYSEGVIAERKRSQPRIAALSAAVETWERRYEEISDRLGELSRQSVAVPAVRALAVKLATAIGELRSDLSDESGDAVWVTTLYRPTDDADAAAWYLTPLQIAQGRAKLLLDECRAAGLLSSDDNGGTP